MYNKLYFTLSTLCLSKKIEMFVDIRCPIRAVGSSFRLGRLKARAEGPRKFFNLESLKGHLLDVGEDLTEF
jgi:hypothetical protein